ncbi:MAG TPA: ATP-binding cassette domain-containing protein [Alphaproteobacteria bacterium]|nr:ATP-binding cassette domain-containing protein [Alphaproteobacteria bacterium]
MTGAGAGAAEFGPIVEVTGLHKYYHLPRETLLGTYPVVRAVNGVSLTIERGRSFGVVGESGCGKSTLARTVMGLEPPTAGTVKLLGQEIHALDADALRRLRRNFQMVFQDPFGSLDPRQKVGRIVAEPLALLGSVAPDERRGRVAEVLEAVGLKAADTGKFPHEFSGGQRQRIAIARALITRPALIVADEPVSALDVSVQAQVLNLLQDLQDDFGVTYLFISHDLAVVRFVCDEVAVMQDGVIVEHGPADQIFLGPQHAYTRTLLAAVPRLPAG